MTLRSLRRAVLPAFCAAIVAFAAHAETTSTNAVDLGRDDDLKKGNNYHEKTPSEVRKEAAAKREKEMKKQAASITYHIKQLKSSKDETERATAAEYLGVLAAYIAIPDLIDCLRPARKEKDSVMRAANGSLIKLTQKNFGVAGYEDWNKWWISNKTKFMEEKKTEVPETEKITAESANVHGLELMKMGEFQSAFNQFLIALDKNPKVVDYHNNAGLAVMEMGRPLDAMEYFHEAIGINKDLPQPYMNIGRCYGLLNRTAEAHAWYDKAKEHDPKGLLSDIFWMIGKEYLKNSQFKLAYEYLDQARVKAEKRRLKDPRLYNDLAICHYGLDQYHSAWKEICNIRYLGYEPNADFVGKVRKMLIDSGTDPDEEDRIAREHFAEMYKGDDDDSSSQQAAAKPKEPSILDSLKQSPK